MKKLAPAGKEKQNEKRSLPDHAVVVEHTEPPLTSDQQLAQAEKNTREALKLEPDNLEIHRLLASILAEGRRWTEAIAACNPVLVASPEDCEIRILLARCLFEIGSVSAAELLLAEICAHQPSNAGATEWLAKIKKAKKVTPSVRQPSAAALLFQQTGVDSARAPTTAKKPADLVKPAKSRMKFRESRLAHKYLDGLTGLEIGGSAHNPFGLKSRNVDYCADLTTVFKRKEVELCGEALKVDVVTPGDELPLPDESENFVLSSHVIEHFFDPIKAIKEWLRVVRPGGYVFIIAPHKERTFDKDRTRTPLQELLDRHDGKIPKPDVDTHKHYSVWMTEDLLEVCRHFNWTVVEFQDVDDKVGNGFTLVIQKTPKLVEHTPKLKPHEPEAIEPKLTSLMQNRGGEYHLFILWEAARNCEEKILADLEKTFEIIAVREVRWSAVRVAENFTRFYGQKLPPGSHKEEHCGKGPLLAVLVHDRAPLYENRRTSKGERQVNANTFDAKQRYREWTGGGHRVHATDNENETRHDFALLFSLSLGEFVASHSEKWDGQVEHLNCDLAGAEGWADLKQFFSILNETVRYAVLRNYEWLPDQFKTAEHGDIDLLVDSAEEIAFVANAQKVFPEPFRIHYGVVIAGEEVRFDFRYVGDEYYDPKWERVMLATRQLNERGFYVLSDEHYFYSLFYHALIHKPKIAADYVEKLVGLAGRLKLPGVNGLTFSRPERGKRLLDVFLQLNDFGYRRPKDVSVHYNEKLLREIPSGLIQPEAVRGLPALRHSTTLLSAKGLTEHDGVVYFSVVHEDLETGGILKQATGNLAWRDAEFLRRLAGPHFPRVLEARQENGWSVAIFERIAGRELTEIIPEIAATPKTLAAFFGECLDIIEALQVAGITHRDIQMQNIMVRDGHPVLIDFGWAIASDAPCFDPGDLGGNGRPPDDSFCDVYSMGKTFSVCVPVHHRLFATLISAMTAVDPAQRVTEVAALRKILNDVILPAAWEQIPVFQTNTRKFKIGFLTADPKITACAYLRLTAPLEHLHARKEIEHLAVCDLVDGRLKIDEPLLRQAQVIVVQRGLAAFVPYHILRRAIPNPAVKIVFELDDALTLLPRSHQAYQHFQSVRPHLETYLKNADLVTVSTPKLKELYSHFNDNIEVLPNTVDAAIWLPAPAKPLRIGKLTILFSGTVTHEHDLALVERAIERIIREFPEQVEFLFWGNAPATLKKLRQIKTVDAFMPNYKDYAARLKTLPVDLALVPLEVVPFNQAKSPVKWLEYSACKIPGIYTNIEAYNQVVDHGKTGWLVPNNAEAWHEAMKKLILDDDLRRGIAENAHRAVLARHMLKQNTHLWTQAYERALALPAKKISNQAAQVSIIIPTFNNLSLTRQCLNSIFGNTPQGLYEIIVVDNGSTDGTPAFLKKEEAAGSLRAVFMPQNRGFAHGCNQGALAAKYPDLLFLNNDTIATSGWLTAMLTTAEKSEVGIVGAKLLYANNTIQHAGIGWINGVPDHPHRHAHPSAPEVSTPRELDMVTGACFLIHRDLFLQLAGFDEIYRNGVEDIDLCLRVRAAGRKVVYEPKAVVYHLEGQSVGRFNHVNENLKIFFGRWGKSFDGKKNFMVPHPAKITPASRSLLLDAAKSDSAKLVKVDWSGSFLDHGSLSHVNRELTGALKTYSGFQVSRVTSGSQASLGFEKLAGEISTTASPDATLTVRHAWPPNWKRPLNGKIVVIQPWEFGALPEDWVRQAHDVDEFWVPSQFVRNCYIESGVAAKKVFVVPNGVDAEKFHPQVAPMKLATQKKFKFLFVGGTIGRKGPDLLLQAYLKNFTAADDVCLVIKDFGGSSVYQGQTFENQIRKVQAQPNMPEILYLNEELPPKMLPGLYSACDCFVLPYRGEGFGLPVLEAMACGLPVIVTACGATDDFVRDEFAWRIPAERKIFGTEVSGMKLAGDGWLLEPNLSVLGEKMRHAFKNSDEVRERGKLASRHAREFFSWKKSADAAAHRIRELAAGQPATVKAAKKNPIVLPPVAHIGQLNDARELFRQKQFQSAWAATITAIEKRPFHSEAFLLLAEIALAVGDGHSAKLCAQCAHDLAPGWNAPKQFLKKSFQGNAKLEWLKLPDRIGSRLSVCLIVKNEEAFLAQCLKSVRNVAQQIIVVDTGSTDRTVEIAKEFGAEIYSSAWCDDFSAARNAVLEHATGDWILMLDADEELPVEQHAKLLADMKKTEVIGYRLPLINREHEAEGRNFVPRLFRNAPGVYYFGRIHEQVFPSLLTVGKPWGLKTALGTAEILHHGYTKELVRDRNKIERNLKLLRQAVGENPTDANLMMNFGLELVRSNDLVGGMEKYREAFELMSTQVSEELAPELCEVLLTQFTCQLYKIRAHEEVVRVLNSPLAKRGELTASHHFALGLSLFELKQYREAAEQMRQCVAGRKRVTISPINSDVLTAAPNHCLALCLVKDGDFAGAEKVFLAALAEQGRLDDIQLDYAKFLAGQNRQVEALQQLNQLVAANSRNVAAWRTGGEIALSRPEFLEFARDWTGEAVRYFTEDLIVLAQRAEALMLSEDTTAAAELWERTWNGEPKPATLAALILCEMVELPTTHAPQDAQEEAAASREFIVWYRKLLAVKAQKTIVRLNEQVEKLSRALPGAAKIIEATMAEMERCV